MTDNLKPPQPKERKLTPSGINIDAPPLTNPAMNPNNRGTS